jgi:hypothetical protein
MIEKILGRGGSTADIGLSENQIRREFNSNLSLLWSVVRSR